MGLSGRVPRRVDTATKQSLLELIYHAVDESWTVRDARRLLELNDALVESPVGRRRGLLDTH